MSRKSWPLLGFLAVLALAFLVPRLLELAPKPAPIGGPFTLTDQQGKSVTDADFRGKFMLVYFGYSFCPDVCPTTLNEVMKVYRELSPEQQARLAPIFITVDPARDTVDQMNQYVTSFSPALIGLTGTADQIAAAERGYHVYARKAGKEPNYTMDHTSILYLMDQDGKFLRHFNGDAPSEEIAKGLREALGS